MTETWKLWKNIVVAKGKERLEDMVGCVNQAEKSSVAPNPSILQNVDCWMMWNSGNSACFTHFLHLLIATCCYSVSETCVAALCAIIISDFHWFLSGIQGRAPSAILAWIPPLWTPLKAWTNLSISFPEFSVLIFGLSIEPAWVTNVICSGLNRCASSQEQVTSKDFVIHGWTKS